MNLSKENICIYDGGGLFVSLALRLAELKVFNRVDYMREWQDGFCNGTELAVGSGLEKFGVNRIKYFWQHVNDYGLIIFPDVWGGDLQEYLRSIGKRVWGAGMKGNLEQARWQTRDLMKSIGLPTSDAEQIRGITALRAYLKQNENVFVKVSSFRGLAETFESKNYVQSKSKLDELEARYGAMMDVLDFIVEKAIPDAKEIGYDGYCIDGEFPNNAFFGPEIKNKAYFGKLVDYDELPREVREANTKLSYHMDGYRQFWSTELRNDTLIDITARHASPAGETFCQAFDNLPEILWYGAEGKLVHAKSSAKYVAQIILCSEWAENHPFALQFPEAIRPFVKIYNHCHINGVDYCIPDETRAKEVGSVIGLGNTPQEAVNAAKDRAKQVTGFQLYAECDALDEAMSEMKGLEQ